MANRAGHWLGHCGGAGPTLEVQPSSSRHASVILAKPPDSEQAFVNKGLELMGRSLLQQIALEHDAMAHLAPEALEFNRIAQSKVSRQR